ncbi:Zinc finger protein castor like [Schistosoma japonicum]|nr:Zinc finger protein castor like [Schistosoma japonicum]
MIFSRKTSECFTIKPSVTKKTTLSKVYVSTSDVQMHANYHRKDAIIIQEGFQRFRATENCGITKCPFFKEHTTHFHCRQKHKLHHQKNDRFAQDGFRRYIKCENCDFP